MKNICYCCLFVCLTAGCLLPGDQQEQKNYIQTLEEQNKQVKEKNFQLMAQNKRLESNAGEAWQRVDTMQKQNEKLIKENHELFQKLSRERLNNQSKVSQERQKHMIDLEKEKEQLLQDTSNSKGEIQNRLADSRKQLQELEAWQRDDELAFVETVDKLMNNSLPPAQEEAAIREALNLEQTLAKKVEQTRNKSKPKEEESK